MSQDINPGLLLSAILHELRQPFASAVLNVDLAATRIARLRRSLYRAADSLEAIACLEAQLSGDPQRIPQPKLQVVSSVLASIHHKEAKLYIDVPAGLTVVAIPGTLRQVLLNLIVNARKYAPSSTITIRARPLHKEERPWPPTSTIRIPRPMALLTVADDGPGIPEAMRPGLFTPGVSQGQGSGLGLWLCRQYVRANGGDLWLDSTLRGASFSSVWPMVRSPDTPLDFVEFGHAVRHARERAGLTRAAFARRTGFDPSTLANIELARHRCTPNTRRLLVKAMTTMATRTRPNSPKQR